jgi:lipoprotein-anchoring transpeptidase ErfK/SrfK
MKLFAKCAIRTGGALLLTLLVFICSTSTGAQAQPCEKRVEIDKTHQILQAFENGNLVFQSRVSTGRGDRWTPNGRFTAGGKDLMHYSRLYHHAPMPYSVQVHGNVFIHGFTYVPAWPDSHGCIRLPVDGRNPAKIFYNWVETGTPIEITGHWEAVK